MALYGYANLIWIPVALISWSQINLLNWIFVGIGFGLSVSFLLRNLYPVLSATEKQTSKIMLIVVIALHLGLAVTIKWLFFAHGSKIKPGAGAGGSDGETQPAQPGTAPSMMFF